MKLPVMSIEGKEVRSLEVDDSVFGIKPNQAVLHQAFVTQRNNQRAGTAQTKTRGQVQGSTRKTRMQKYTGRARHGGIRAPIFVGGGIAFGPKPRDFGLALNKKMRRLAIRSALSGKVADGELVVIDELSFKAPKTKEVLRILRNVGIQRSALIVTGQPDRTVLASARNLEKTKVLPAAYLNVADMLNHRHLLMTEEAIKVAEGLWGRKRTDARPSGRAAPEPAAETPLRRGSGQAPRRRAKPKAPEAMVETAAPVEAPAPERRRAKVQTRPETPAAKPRTRGAAAARPAESPVEKPRRRAPAAKSVAEKAAKPKTPSRRGKVEDTAEAAAPKPRPRRGQTPARPGAAAKAPPKGAPATETPKPPRRTRKTAGD